MKFFNFLSLIFDSVFRSVSVSVIPFPFPDSGFHVLVLLLLASYETDSTAQVYQGSIYGADGLKGSDSLNQAITSEFCREGKTKKGSSMP